MHWYAINGIYDNNCAILEIYPLPWFSVVAYITSINIFYFALSRDCSITMSGTVILWRQCTTCHILPVLWMTSHLLIIGQVNATQIGRTLRETHQRAAPGAKCDVYDCVVHFQKINVNDRICIGLWNDHRHSFTVSLPCILHALGCYRATLY